MYRHLSPHIDLIHPDVTKTFDAQFKTAQDFDNHLRESSTLSNDKESYYNTLLYYRQEPINSPDVIMLPDNTYSSYLNKQYISRFCSGAPRWCLLGQFRGTCHADGDQVATKGRCSLSELPSDFQISDAHKLIMFNSSSSVCGYLYQTSRRMMEPFSALETTKTCSMVKPQGTIRENLVNS